jgi:hypothetical protein
MDLSVKKYRVQPFDLPEKVNERNYRGIFGDFRDVVSGRIAELRATKAALNIERARFFEFLLKEVDAEAYGKIQEHYLSPKHLEAMTVKYLDPIGWFESKVAVAQRLKLNEKKPMKILDFGTGPGHFPVVARFYGHDVTGTDLPGRENNDDNLYSALCKVYGVKRIGHQIQAFKPLDDLPGRFDMVTGFLTAFNYENHTPWDIDRWKFFLRSLKQHVLTENGIVYFMLTRGKLTDEAWSYLSSIADWSVEPSREVYFSDLSRVTPPMAGS